MSVNPIPESSLRSALRPCRVDADVFEAAVLQRLTVAMMQQAVNPFARFSPLLKSAAAFIPLEILAGCKAVPASARLAPVAGGLKVLSYLAFPAISLFVLLGATIFSVTKIRSLREPDGSGLGDEQALHVAIALWWRRNRWGAGLLFAATLALAIIGATELLFLFYLMSFGLLLYVLATFAKAGLGNRAVIGRSCMLGLMLLGQAAGISGIGIQSIHFLDQTLVSAVFFGGVLLLLPLVAGRRMVGPRRHMTGVVLISAIVIPLMIWMMNPILWPATPLRMKHYVESFVPTHFPTVRWPRWEIVTRWLIESKLDPDLTPARRQMTAQIQDEPNPFILGTALRVGLLDPDQIRHLKEFERSRHSLVDELPRGLKPQIITSLSQLDWVIRGAVLNDRLTSAERDRLELRLHATLDDLSTAQADVLESALRVTQLLELIHRPVDRERYRGKIHDWLRKLHTLKTGGFQLAGGFTQYQTTHAVGSLISTAHAVELMEYYGVPEGLELNWVRSFLRPTVFRFSDDKWVAAATLGRLDHLPGVSRPGWFEFLYYERSLVAAMVLVGLCFYATLISPDHSFTAERKRAE